MNLQDLLFAVIWAALVDDQRAEFPTVHHFRGYVDGAQKSGATLAIPLEWMDFLSPEIMEACS